MPSNLAPLIVHDTPIGYFKAFLRFISNPKHVSETQTDIGHKPDTGELIEHCQESGELIRFQKGHVCDPENRVAHLKSEFLKLKKSA